MAAEPNHLHPEAQAELREAVIWYRARSEEAAVAFVAELDKVIQSVASAPERWPLLGNVTPPTRYRVFPKFPYTLFYRVREAGFFVVAVAHQRRRPLYWAKRR